MLKLADEWDGGEEGENDGQALEWYYTYWYLDEGEKRWWVGFVAGVREMMEGRKDGRDRCGCARERERKKPTDKRRTGCSDLE